MQSLIFPSAAAPPNGPSDWACGKLERQVPAASNAPAATELRGCDSTTGLLDALHRLQASGFAAAFDIARYQYAAAVQTGLMKRSLLGSADFERRLGRLERLALGPWARTV